MSRRLRTEAVVLKRQELGESDRLVTLLSKEAGKFTAVAKGARRSRRRFGGCLDSFCRIRILYVDKGAARLRLLEEAVLLDSHQPIRGDLVAIGHAAYAAELSVAFLGEGDEAPDHYDLLVSVLSRLDRGPLNPVEIRQLEIDLLGLSGFAPRLSECAFCGTERADGWLFDYDQDGIVCPACAARSSYTAILTPETLEFLRALQKRESPEAVSEPVMKNARKLLARIIDKHTGRPLKSREFLRQLAGK